MNSEDATQQVQRRTSSPPAPDIAAATHKGHVRKNNEDHYLVMRFGRFLETLSTNLDESALARGYDRNGFGLVVADGLGGMSGGEIASRMALARLVELVVETPDWMLSVEREHEVTTVLNRMAERFMKVDETLRTHAERDDNLRGMGTTLTVAALIDNELIVGHIGDSRAYLLRGDELTQVTRDHTLIQALVDAGVASHDDVGKRSLRHVLTAAMGSLGNLVKPQLHQVQVSTGDQILLCTDGLTEMVDDKNITSILLEASTAQKACEDLVAHALAGGGTDNITVIVARIE